MAAISLGLQEVARAAPRAVEAIRKTFDFCGECSCHTIMLSSASNFFASLPVSIFGGVELARLCLELFNRPVFNIAITCNALRHACGRNGIRVIIAIEL